MDKLFTYQITEAEYEFLAPGYRIAVEFGRSKIYTAVVNNKHQNPPVHYKAKPIHQILDEQPIVTEQQLKHWNWISSYYMCSMGDVLRAALPSAFLLESETSIVKQESFEDEASLSDQEYLVYDALNNQSELTIFQVVDILGKKTVFPLLKKMMEKGALKIKETIYESYKPKLEKYIKLSHLYAQSENLNELLDSLGRAQKQKDVILSYFQLKAGGQDKHISQKDLETSAGCTSGVIKALVDKNILEVYTVKKDRVQFDNDVVGSHSLTDFQQIAFNQVQESFKTFDITLFHGVTGSGKTEIYNKLIEEKLAEGKQVLFLLPEIALTTQIVERLKQFFGNKIVVFHSKYSNNERVEAWNKILNNNGEGQVILGARSAVFLPFRNLDLVIVDEEHEVSYKQFDPAPRYQARDTAIVLGKMWNAKVLLGSATPSIESYFNATQNKYGLVSLDRRYGNVQLPEVELVDIKEKHRKKRMQGHFSDRMITLIEDAIEEHKQVILFQNRRGYSPVVECNTCGESPQCPNCDVSLTYHKYRSELKCHYCGYQQAMLLKCNACGSPDLDTKGFGTEQIEQELKTLFPKVNVGRMDLDTTRGKYGYERIISQFENQEIQILVGTQMLSKGLDFKNVAVVGVLNADNMLNFPDFRAFERCFQLLVQVSGRSGRGEKRGRVAIQTFNPYHQILQQVSTNDYQEMYKEQIEERWQFKYPPYHRLIKITLKNRDYNRLNNAANWLGKSFTNVFGELVLGPTVPAVARIRNEYIQHITIKIAPKQSIKASKDRIIKIKNAFDAIGDFKSVKMIVDVDSY